MSPVRSVRWQSCFSWTRDENSWEMSPRRATAAMCSDDDVTNSQSPPVDHEGCMVGGQENGFPLGFSSLANHG
ncbi:unnamed protein product [Sphagnum jensenii]|uniref:Uncharacterized protein n=1 Tax=Sphagnum jensenii TaxID=128206 RepID=A0ABP1APA5_9BRYO